MDSCLAIDIGGTKLAAGVVSDKGRLVSSSATPTPQTTDPEVLFGVLAGLVTDVMRERPEMVACGVGCGGPMSAHGEEVSPLNIPAWDGFPLRSRLAELTGLGVTVENDAKALALGEGWVGAARGKRNFMAMVVSTGVGGGIVSDARLLDGRLGNAGHVGHVIVCPGGRKCACGATGCLEAEASGKSIREMTGRRPAEAGPEVIVAHRHPGRQGGRVRVESLGPRPHGDRGFRGSRIRRPVLRGGICGVAREAPGFLSPGEPR